jgi:hypothetical protein
MPQGSTELELPASWLATEPALPDCCSRHGRPAVRRARFVIQSKPPKQSRLGTWNMLGIAGYLIERQRQVKIVRVAGWPLCASCRRTRIVGLYLAQAMFWGGLAAFVSAIVVRVVRAEPDPLLAWPMLGGFALMLGSPVALTFGGLGRIVRARTAPDGSAVLVTGPDPEFARQLRATLPAGSGR